MMRLDAHQHFWRYDAEQYPWIPPGSALHRDWLPADLLALQQPLGFQGSIAVQARQSLAESDWLLGLADACPALLGVVGWVDLRHPDVALDLARLARHPRFVGVRHVVQDEADPDFMLQPEFQRGLSLLADFDLTYDFLVFHHQLPATLEVARRLPHQAFVLDHVAKPAIRDRGFEPWATHLRALAKLPNVHCKVSGMVTEADWKRWRPEDFRPYLDLVFEAFGPTRVMFGSDWPVCLHAAAYDRVVALLEDYASSLDSAQRAAFFGGNALRFYLGKTSLTV
ncbi:MAG: amidohydrolase family protein [Verrucomicrobiales bacterium]|nr:amidohydrolase family protein [Verrucomicrobiales bacterium]